MSARPDLLGLLPFADVADPDPDALPFGDEAVRWSPDEAASGHPFRATERVPGWCVTCGTSWACHGPTP